MGSRLFFEASEFETLIALTEAILPRDGASPGAADLDVPKFLDLFVHASSVDVRDLWRFGLRAIDDQSERAYGKGFVDLSETQAGELLGATLAPDAGEAPLGEFVKTAKAATIKAYYRTEYGLHEELRVPKPKPSAFHDAAGFDFPDPDRSRSRYDVVVVGSGATGGWAAKELTEAGYEVLVLDMGTMPAAGPQPRQPYEVPLRNMFDNLSLNGARRPVQARSWACDEYRAGLFIDDLDHPYEGADRFTWIRGSSVGGRMNVWGRQVYRYAHQDFSASQMRGQAEPWPLTYADLAPFYDEVESFIGVSGTCDGLDRAPDGRFLPAMPMTEGEDHLRRAVESRWPDRRVIIGRTATITQDHAGRTACQGSSHCYRGCPTKSFFEPLGSTLAAARSTGRLHLMPQAHVSRIVMDDELGRARGVAFVDGRDGLERIVEARAVVLAASTLSSTRILLATRSPGLPDGLGSSSGVLGAYLHGHIHSVMCSGKVPWILKPVGVHDESRPNYIHIPQFLNNEGQAQESGFVGGFGIEGAVKHYMFPKDLALRPGVGRSLKESIRSTPVPAHFFLTAFGVMLARSDNRVQLSNLRDKWDIPTIKVDCSYGDNDLNMAQAMAGAIVEIAREANFTIDTVLASPGSPGLCVHEVGTARMGITRHGFVLDAHNRVWDAPNVLVVDGACFPSSGPQNPTLTMMALSLRASRQLARDLRI